MLDHLVGLLLRALIAQVTGAKPLQVQMYPHARVTETQAGHFLQEEVPVDIAEAIERVVAAVAAK